MLLIDGVKYEEWTPKSEDEFEQVVSEHTEAIFGKDAKYFDLKHKLASKSGTGSIPDGYVITIGSKPQVQIIEFELVSHSLQHIVSQIVNIINGIENPTTQQRICNAVEDGINEDEIFAAKMAKATRPVATHRFISDSFSNAVPIINIIIDKSLPVLKEAISKIAPPPRIIEFQTFAREGVGIAVHAHLYEPVFSFQKIVPPHAERLEVLSKKQLYREFFSELVGRYSRENPSWHWLKAQPSNWLGFGAGKSGLWFNWTFKNDKRFAVELYIDTGDQAKNKWCFDKIKQREAEIGIPDISWERLDINQASRIAIYTTGEIREAMSNASDKERLVLWAVGTMKNFSQKLQPIISNLR